MLAPNECYSLSSLAALREVNSLKTNMTKSQAEAVLNSLVVNGWLLKSKQVAFHSCLVLSNPLHRRGRYSLSTRTLLELLPYLKSNYPDECLECTICMEVRRRFRGFVSPSRHAWPPDRHSWHCVHHCPMPDSHPPTLFCQTPRSASCSVSLLSVRVATRRECPQTHR